MLFMYNVRWWYDGEIITSSGIVYGEDMADATRHLTTTIYEDVEDIHIYAVEYGDSGYLPLNILNNFLKENPLKDEEDCDQAFCLI